MQGSTRSALREEVDSFLAANRPGFCIVGKEPEDVAARMAREVAEGLSRPRDQKTLPSTYFYDKRGSELYEQITALPEYYPTRTEAAILQAHAESLRDMLGPIDIVELGSGSSAKTRILLDAWDAEHQPVTYLPIDVSDAMLTQAAQSLTREYPQLRVLGLAGQYEESLALIPQDTERLFMFLGGTIGNFSAEVQAIFFERLIQRMSSGSKLLLGFDRRPHAGKPAEVIRQAYNDNAGVTAAFNLNVLAHINWRLGADFELSQWRHVALYNETAHQIEMYLESQRQQTVRIDELAQTFAFEQGERILTEVSRKFDLQELAAWFEKIGFTHRKTWTDERELFGLMLLAVR